MLDPTTQYELVQVLHKERLQELEKARLVQEFRLSQPSRKIHAVILAALGRVLMILGKQMQSHADTKRQQTPRRVSS